MEVSLGLQPGDNFAAIPIGKAGGEPAIRLGRLGGAGSITISGSVPDLRRLGVALLEAAGPEEE